ncbi:MAG: amino acid--tRNA ligase-related protein, partial [Patescibacteria group bacterium]
MSSIDEIRKVRLQKLKSLQDSGLLAYPAKTKRTHSVLEALKNFSKISKSGKEIILAGRIMALRGHGGATFLDIQDGSDYWGLTNRNKKDWGVGDPTTFKVQGLIKEDKLGPKGYKFFIDHFDIGDFVEIRGILIKTKRGEQTIEVSDYKMLAKSLLPLPEKWHGLQDVEEKLRKRYLDILFNPEIKEMVRKRAVFWNSMREFLMEKGFLEVETPVLEVTTGGADAKPFITHHNAL